MQRYLTQKIKDVWEYNSFIAVGWITYIYLVVACLLQFHFYEIHDRNSYANYTLLFIIFSLLILMSVIFFRALYNSDNLKTDQLIQTKYLFLVDGLKR